jgi:hypothetical protein
MRPLRIGKEEPSLALRAGVFAPILDCSLLSAGCRLPTSYFVAPWCNTLSLGLQVEVAWSAGEVEVIEQGEFAIEGR